MRNSRLITLFLLFCLSTAAEARDIIIETESFADKGGWVVDHEAFTKIQSAYIMAHGIGRPVDDAVTTFNAEPGSYNVWVSTYNWTAPWYDGEGPGAFTIKVNGSEIGGPLGTTGNQWGWVKAGRAELGRNNTLVLHDLTGFNGRADAVLFTTEEKVPDYANTDRHIKTDFAGNYDLVVAGGGIAGCSTALTAARLGMKVALINNVPWLGGNIMYGAHACGKMFSNLYPNLGYTVCELIGARKEEKNNPGYYTISKSGCSYPNPDAELPSWEEVEKGIASTPFIDAWNRLSKEEKYACEQEETDYVKDEKERLRIAYVRERLLREAGVHIYANRHIYAVETTGRKIRTVIARDMQGGNDIKVKADLFVDCTGDGDLGYLAGAEYMIGREDKSFAGEKHAPDRKDMKMMGSSIYWRAFNRKDAGTFPDVSDIPWAAQCDADYHIAVPKNRWWWETGMEIDNALEPELVRDNYLRCLFGNWAYIKNHVDGFKNMRLDYLNFIAAKRESRRIVGAIVLNENDIVDKKTYPDASFTTSWPMDLHYAKKDNAERFPGWEWQTYCTNSDPDFHVHKYDVPYRVLCCRDIDNLFIGGRALSVTHMALGTVRVQCTLGMAGEVTAMAARICKDHKAMPLDVYEKYLDELKAYMKKGSLFEGAKKKTKPNPLEIQSGDVSKGAFGWATCTSLTKTGYKLNGGDGGSEIVLKSNGELADRMLKDAITNNSVIVLDGSNGPFVIGHIIPLIGLKDKTIYGINGAELKTAFEMTEGIRAALDSAQVKKVKNKNGNFYLSNKMRCREWIEYCTRQVIIDFTGDQTEAYRESGIFFITKCENIIIRNLKFTGPGSVDIGGRDLIRINDNCFHLWIDHCSFADGQKGHINFSQLSNFLTISNCSFVHTARSYSHAFSILIGGSFRKEDAGMLNVTLAGNWWGNGCKMRVPMGRSGHVHVYNNYYDCPGANGGVNPRDSSHFLIENCYFSAQTPKCVQGSKASAYTLRGNYSERGVVFPADYGKEEKVPYKYRLMDTFAVPNYVQKNAGAKLIIK